jgi:cholesterol oxidase
MNNHNNVHDSKSEDFPKAVRWISEGFEELLLEESTRNADEKLATAFDLVIVGSGYGGALAAKEFSGRIDAATGKPLKVCLLERGREYLAGMFPGSEAELPGAFTINGRNSPDPYGAPDGVIDLRVGKDVSVLLSSGLGGGSLINAGVMEKAQPWVFTQKCWPEALRRPGELDPWYDAARKALSSNQHGTFSRPIPTKKREALFRLNQVDDETRQELQLEAARDVDSYIPVAPVVNPAGVRLEGCKRCGDCMTGCNQRAKNSLDQNALAIAWSRGARIICGATVMRLERAHTPDGAPCWDLWLLHTDPLLRRRQVKPFKLRVRRAILAAGSFGSTEILLRSRSKSLEFSSQLGERFSANGDLIASSFGEKLKVNAVARETEDFHLREVGPTTASMMRAGNGEKQIVIQEFAIPGPIRRLFSEGFTTSKLFHRLGNGDPDFWHGPGQGAQDPYAVDPETIDRTQAIGIMGHDDAGGRLVLERRRGRKQVHEPSHLPLGETAVTVRWRELKQPGGLFDSQMQTLELLAKVSKTGGAVLANPFWRLLPEKLNTLLDMKRGPALTTHPLGGCAVADTWHDGVVDECGRVFDCVQSKSVHEGLAVLDGSLIPCSLGINPAFTISALVLRALDGLKTKWNTAESHATPRPIPRMPSFKAPQPAADVVTNVSIHERSVGDLHLVTDVTAEAEYTAELTLTFAARSARDLARQMGETIDLDPEKSCIRIYERDLLRKMRDRGETEFHCQQRASFHAPLSGKLRLLEREQSTKPCRVARGLWAWFHNRGKRDAWNKLMEWMSGEPELRKRGIVPPGMLSVASHSGEARRFGYDLIIGESVAVTTLQASGAATAHAPRRPFPIEIRPGTRLRAFKRFTYSRASNPWTQLSEMELTHFPGLDASGRTVLALEPKHFAREQKHLFEIVSQRDGATGLMELCSFLLYVMRVVAAIHVWSFRKPDEPSRRRPRRLPGEIPGALSPIIKILEVDAKCGPKRTGKKVKVRLARYRREGARMPVLLIHGFSASGTTFAHPELRPGLARYLHDQGRDVWVIDLRTSAGMRSSRRPWDFEDVAGNDIPDAVDYIVRETGVAKIDVVAHCMGAAMFTMALLREKKVGCGDVGKLATQVRSIVLSQVGPMVAFTAANVFRAYCVSYIQHVFRENNFDFRPKPGAGSEFLDRLLATVPYPYEEFEYENPGQPCAKTPYTVTRHRMDAWFGRVFNVANMDAGVLERIDDFFGAINLHTSFQTIHFARRSMITTRRGRNAFIVKKQLERLNDIPIFGIHGAKNGLADPATLVRMQVMTSAMGIQFTSWRVPDFGHQDCIMGRDAPRVVFPEIEKFLDDPKGYKRPDSPPPDPAPGAVAVLPGALSFSVPPVLTPSAAQIKCTAQPPFMGPLVSLPDDSGVVVAIASDPRYEPPEFVVSLPADRVDEAWRTYVLSELRAKRTPWREHHFNKKAPDDTPHWYPIREHIDKEDVPAAAVYLFIHVMPPIIPGGWTNPAAYMTRAGADPIDPATPLWVPGWVSSWVHGVLARNKAVAEALELLLCDTSIENLLAAHAVLPKRMPTDFSPVRFALASCQYPAGPLDPNRATASYSRLRSLVENPATAPRCALLVGDQIYADATAGVFDPTQLDDRFELPYEEWLQSRHVRDVLRRLPMYTTVDDHEIDNNWERGLPPFNKNRQRRRMGLDGYFRIQRAAGPPVPEVCDPSGYRPAWYRARIDGLHFFFCDTRSERDARNAGNLAESRIMCEEQEDALESWLEDTAEQAPRFVVSGSLLLPRRKLSLHGGAGALHSDTWDGYPNSLHRLLALIARTNARNLVFLSGDEHHSCIARIEVAPCDGSADATVLHSVHSSALNAPFPFANGEVADLQGEDDFDFQDPRSLGSWFKCNVSTHFVQKAGDGFAVLDCHRGAAEAGWRLECGFDRPGGTECYAIDAGGCRPMGGTWSPVVLPKDGS